MKLLIVDDSEMMRYTIQDHLQGYDLDIVGEASNGAEALEMLREKDPDLVTLDITMPEMDGLECLEKMKVIKPDVKVMVITALSDKHTGLQAIRKGAKEYLFKPITKDTLKVGFDHLLNLQTA